ncbi:MAG TPA: integration host factor, actinobacterial type, partial [Propionibacteriaceae bacterium]|nr:integration host factor, actinobacterial type [Propionibacteriaceae bacterium]
MTIPPLSDEQRQQARHAATEARRRRAEMKQALRSGERSLAQVLDIAEDDDVIAHTKVIDV